MYATSCDDVAADGAPKKKKACKDCTCGLAEELAQNDADDSTNTSDAMPKSSCGSVRVRSERVNRYHADCGII